VGGLIGNAAVPGAGALPGGFIGAAVAGISALIANNIYDYSEYVDYKKNLDKGARDSLEAVVVNKLGEDSRCVITQEVATFPVSIHGEHHIYEKIELEKWVKVHGTSPMTRKRCGLGDIEPNFVQFAKLGKACDEVLNEPQERAKLKEHELKGLTILRAKTLQLVEDIYEKNLNQLIDDKKQKKLTPKQFAQRTVALAKFADPIIGEEAVANRR
jgi:hypothetical protein